MLFDTLTEYIAEIQTTRRAIRRQLLIGSQHRHDSGDSSRATTEINLAELKTYLSQLQREKAIMEGKSSGMIRVVGGG